MGIGVDWSVSSCMILLTKFKLAIMVLPGRVEIGLWFPF